MTSTQATSNGVLYIVATPIGNKEDISLRALTVLKTVDIVLAEDTRHSMQLFNLLGIKNQLMAFHAHNEKDKTPAIIHRLQQGQSIALISDAGTPLISDPGYPLVKKAREEQIEVVPIPGACALITALSASGLPCDSFLFNGFLPAKSAARKNKLTSLYSEQHTLIFYESTHRIIDCLNDIQAVYGDAHELVLAKELTKTFERFITGNVQQIKQWLLAADAHTKGEFVVMIPPVAILTEKNNHEALLKILLDELPLKQAVKIACKITQAPKNEMYELALSIK